MLIQILPGRICFYIWWWDANVESEGNCWDAELLELVFRCPQEMRRVIGRRVGSVWSQDLCVVLTIVMVVKVFALRCSCERALLG